MSIRIFEDAIWSPSPVLSTFPLLLCSISRLVLNRGRGPISRRESARVILQRIDSQVSRLFDHVPVFLCGDFNSEPQQEAYIGITHDSVMQDIAETMPPPRRYGNDSTFTGFSSKIRQKRIDFVFANTKVHKTKIWETQGYAVLSNRFEDEVYNSGMIRLPPCVLVSAYASH